jgi:hypothetical protein
MAEEKKLLCVFCNKRERVSGKYYCDQFWKAKRDYLREAAKSNG